MTESTPDTLDQHSNSPWPRPRSREALHRWLREVLGLTVPRSALIEGHASPFDYLCFAFFEEPPEDDGPEASTDDRDCVVWANRGGGKTFLGAVATLLDLVFKPGIAVRILGGSLEQSARMHAHLAALLDNPALSPLVEGRITRKGVKLVNGSECQILAQSHTSVRGTRVQKLRCDEVELFDPEIWEAAQLVTTSKRCGDQLVRGSVEALSTMHKPHGLMFRIVKEAPESGRSVFRWGVVDVLQRCDDTHHCESCSLKGECKGGAKRRAEDEAGHIRIDDALTLKSRVSKQTWEAEMLSLRPSRSDCVYPEFDPRTHVVQAVPPDRDGWAWIGGMDFGYRSDTVFLHAGLDRRGVLYIVREHVRSCMVLDEHIDAIRAGSWPSVEWIGVDPAGRNRHEQTGASNVGLMRRAGLEIKARKIPLLAGIELVRTRLRPADGRGPGLYISEACPKLIESLQRYRFPSDDPTSLKPVKDGADHAADALRYMVQNLDKPTKVAFKSWT
ncbi:MAG: hypothetical protein JJU33_02765 [Phycisphaerales bacterium]|nr:hypothetical protein [Phycisphaerales bacterium]